MAAAGPIPDLLAILSPSLSEFCPHTPYVVWPSRTWPRLGPVQAVLPPEGVFCLLLLPAPFLPCS